MFDVVKVRNKVIIALNKQISSLLCVWYMVFSLIRIHVIIKMVVSISSGVVMVSKQKLWVLIFILFTFVCLVSKSVICVCCCVLFVCKCMVCIRMNIIDVFLMLYSIVLFRLGSIINVINVIIGLLIVCIRFMLSGKWFRFYICFLCIFC